MSDSAVEFDPNAVNGALEMTGKYGKTAEEQETVDNSKAQEQDAGKGDGNNPEQKEETKVPRSESVADKNKSEEGQQVTKNVQKRIDKLTRQKKEAQEEVEKLKARLAEKETKKPEEPKHKLSDEQYRDAVFNGAIERIVAEDKEKPLEKRRVLSADEMDELLADSPGKFSKWQNEYGNFEADLKNNIELELKSSKEDKKEDKPASPDENFSYEKFTEDHPDLAFFDLMKDIPKDVLEDDAKLISALKEKDQEIGSFFEFVNENRDDYPDLESLNKAAKDYNAQKGDLRLKALEKEIEELKAENERLNNIDTGIRNNGHKTHEDRKDTELEGSINSALSMAGFGG